MNTTARKPRLTLSQIIHMSLGFMGIQVGFALQNGNASRILQNYGADVEHLSLFWLAAPITGMIVQPLIGHYSDRTWNGLGRRRPYILAGAIMTSIALILMPNISWFTAVLPPLMVGAGMLMIMDASINVTMEPFRALVGDNLPSEQRSLGFSVQTFLIGLGAVIGSMLPYVLTNYLGVSSSTLEHKVPLNVIYSFYCGAALLIATILWTVFKTKEYSPEELYRFEQAAAAPLVEEKKVGFFSSLAQDFKHMPLTMRKLGWVQFLSWFALFMMWVYTTPAIAEHIYYGKGGDQKQLYADAADWVGVLFAVYNAVSAIYSLVLAKLSKRFGRIGTHSLGLAIGGLSLIAIFFIQSEVWVIVPMVGVGIAWGSILAMPYAILSDSLPAKKMGVYMGLFNFFITFPQIICGFFGGLIIKHIFGNQPIWGIVLAGACMLAAAIVVQRIKEK